MTHAALNIKISTENKETERTLHTYTLGKDIDTLSDFLTIHY